MSIAGISSLNLSNVSQASSTPASLRSQEDTAGRQLEQALQAGDLAGAQQAYSTLSAFGPNNSGPFTNPALRSQFAAVGQAIQSGDLAGAQQAIAKLGKNLLIRDYHIAQQDYKNGGLQGAQQAIANLEGDYWAITGQSLAASPPASTAAATNVNQASPAISVRA